MNTKRKVVTGVVAGMLLAMSSGVWAESSASVRATAPQTYSATGSYAGFGFGYAPVSGSSLVTSSNGASISGRLGYAWSPHVSTELALGGIAFVKSGTADVGINMVSAALLAYMPVQERLDAYVKAGYASASVGFNAAPNTVSKRKAGLTYGFGAEFGHGEQTSFRLGVDHYDLSAWSTMPISANDFSFSIDFRL